MKGVKKIPLKDKKKQKEYDKQYYKENCEKRKAYSKQYRKDNPGKGKISDKKYYEEHSKRKSETDKKRRDKIKLYVNNYKLSKGCETCGYKKCVEALLFHHIDNKNKKFDISMVAKYGGNIEKIKNEINKCKVLCCNCHAELHAKLREEGK